jgi:UDP:flavonoid glycosyltransferase YjiC (YdhE family)
MVTAVEAAGFPALILGRSTSSVPERLPLRPVDLEREVQEFRDHFAHKGTQRRAPLTKALCSTWQPDVLVCEETDFGSMIAAESLGLPYATVLVLAAGSFARPEVVGAVLNTVRAEHGLPSDPDLTMLSRYLVLSPFPPSYRHPAYPLPATAHSFRLLLPEPVSEPATWSSVLPSAPTVYFTLGTIFNLESGDLFTRVLTGLRALPVNVVVTVGHHIDPAEFGPQPANIYIEQYIPQAKVLPHCDLVVSHGGSGSVLGALAHGLPSVLIPMGADQPLNAARCKELGLAQALDPIEATPETVREAVATVLADPTYRQVAQLMRDEIAALPEPTYVIRLLERLAAEQRPLTTG